MDKTKKLTRSSFYTALSVLIIYLSTIMPVGRLYLLAVACCIIPISILTTDIKHSLLVYVASSMLSILLLGVKINVFSYIIFFGIYGFVKLYIEKLRKLYIEVFLKLVFYNAAVLIIFMIYNALFINTSNIKLPIYLIVLISEPIFLLCDYVITLFIGYMNRHFIKTLL
ncbi:MULTISPECIES: hypothetical protein [Clostridium]|uniref:hypothetical protein n=1 Tax=Clostridium TaxID=1485 RepID=UPI00069CEDD3|nr:MULTISPECIES: hypothetical protein [Clostridium]KOF56934.1 membrane protein [Clostridium sp. DMHC 10]MCD2346587.1 hypothetical protein [Clostridium guangxiense]